MTNEHDDHDELARLLPDPAIRDLSAHRHRQIQEFLMTEMQPARPLRRPRRRLVLVTASVLAAAAVAAGAVTGGFGLLPGEPGTGPDTTATQQTPAETPAAATFRLAAAHAAAQAWTDPRPDQWTYTKDWSEEPGPLAEAYGWTGPPVTSEWWEKVDGTNVAGYQDSGRVEELGSGNQIPFLMSLPTDPQQLLDKLREKLEGMGGEGDGAMVTDHALPVPQPPQNDGQRDLLLYSYLSLILERGVLPPDVTAALWQAAALIPGVTQQEGTVEIEGHKAIAVSVVMDGWLEVQLLVDPETHAYVGRRALYAADHVYGPEGHNTHAKKGEVEYVTIRLASGIVDKAGDTL